jgi:hypothetical protein
MFPSALLDVSRTKSWGKEISTREDADLPFAIRLANTRPYTFIDRYYTTLITH